MIVVLVGDHQQIDGLVGQAAGKVPDVGQEIISVTPAAAAVDHHGKDIFSAAVKSYEKAVAGADAIHTDADAVYVGRG
jgi:hypothetical protein